jgi:[protein-PII] uridylyltransferase
MALKRTRNSGAPLESHTGSMMRATFPLDPTSAFRASMPDRYRLAFDDAAVREHAAIVARRGVRTLERSERSDVPTGVTLEPRTAHLEIWRQLPKGIGALCVVADDRPGLLSFICASLVLQKMDVLSAQAYTRLLPEGGGEAVDFLWIRRDADADHAMPVLEADVARISQVLGQLITGELSIESAAERARFSRKVPPGASTTVNFDEDDDEGLVVLTVETFDRPGLLLAITMALFRANVQIIASDALTRAGRVVDRFSLVELDGSPIRRARRGVVQIEVLEAIHALSRR